MSLDARSSGADGMRRCYGLVTRERLVSTALGGSAVGLFGLSVLGFLDRIEMGRVAAGLLAVGAVVATIATQIRE
jgi:hypothetical protein